MQINFKEKQKKKLMQIKNVHIFERKREFH